MNHLLDLQSLSKKDIEHLLARAQAMHDGEKPKTEKVRVANLFFEASTRTRTSFEIAERALGWEVISLAMQASSVSKGESLRDTAETLRAMGAKVFVIRHEASGAAAYLAKRVPDIAVVNAGDGQHEHPTQGLLDALTLQQRWKTLAGKRVTIIGDIRHSRVARSNLQGLPRLGVKVKLFGPPSLVPKELGECAASWHDAVAGADALIMLRIQQERMQQGFLSDLADYRRGYGLTKERADALPQNVLVLHPGPMNRGVEIDDSVADGPRSLIAKQVQNGVFVRMAVLSELSS